MGLKKAVVVDMIGMIERAQKPNEIMIQGSRGFYFLHKDGPRRWIGEYFGLQDLKDVCFNTRKDDAIKGCKERLA